MAVAMLAGRPRPALALAALPIAVTAFFRDPERRPDHEQVADDIVLSPADGKVMWAGPAQSGVAPPGQWQQVSVFLSAFDVHINRAPCAGRIEDVSYRPGRWLAAYKPESATENECSEITVVHQVHGEERRVVFRQIVGLMARRVVTRVAPGQVLGAGQRIGLMKFGSRMDVFVDLDVRLTTVKGRRVIAGESILGRWER